MRNKVLYGILLIVFIFCICNNIVFAANETSDISNLPTSYDLRNDIDIRVENQEQRGWCSAYATTKIFETNILKTRGIDYNLSEAYLAYAEAPYFGGNVKWKTDITTARALVSNVLLRNYVLEKDIPNRDYEFNENNKNKFDNAPVIIKDYELEIFDENEEKVNGIKKQVMTNGGVWVSIDSDQKWYNPSTSAIYSNVKQDIDTKLETREQVLKYVKEVTLHAVTIIGWDDNYSRNNFKSSCRPKNNGAWLILNSWGSDWGNNGTAWVSYEDINFLTDIPFGVKNVKLRGEPPTVEFSYVQHNGYVQAIIKSRESLKDIDGWETSDNKRVFLKKFYEQVTPYTINVYSEIDGSSVPVEINITNADFKVYDTNSTIHIEGKYKLNSKDLRVFIVVLVAILIILLVILKHLKKDKRVDNSKN